MRRCDGGQGACHAVRGQRRACGKRAPHLGWLGHFLDEALGHARPVVPHDLCGTLDQLRPLPQGRPGPVLLRIKTRITGTAEDMQGAQ